MTNTYHGRPGSSTLRALFSRRIISHIHSIAPSADGHGGICFTRGPLRDKDSAAFPCWVSRTDVPCWRAPGRVRYSENRPDGVTGQRAQVEVRLPEMATAGTHAMLRLPINRMNPPLIGRRGPAHASDSLSAAASPWVKQVARASPCASMGDAETRRLCNSGDRPSVPSFTPISLRAIRLNYRPSQFVPDSNSCMPHVIPSCENGGNYRPSPRKRKLPARDELLFVNLDD